MSKSTPMPTETATTPRTNWTERLRAASAAFDRETRYSVVVERMMYPANPALVVRVKGEVTKTVAFQTHKQAAEWLEKLLGAYTFFADLDAGNEGGDG